MTTGPVDDLHELSGLYVLDALSYEDRARFESHLRDCAACTADVREMMPVVRSLALAVPSREPAAELRARILSAVAAERIQPGGAGRAQTIHSTWSHPGWLAAAAMLVLAMGLGYLAVTRQQRIVELEARLSDAMTRLASSERQMADLRRTSGEQLSAATILAAPDLARIDLAGQPAAASARGRAFWSRARGMVFSAANLPAPPPGKTYQVWVLTAGTAPISAGVFAPDAGGDGRLIVKTPEDIPPPTAVAVTLEPAGGVPAPTGDKYLVGALP